MALEYRFPLNRNHGFLHIGMPVSTLRNRGVKPPGILKLTLQDLNGEYLVMPIQVVCAIRCIP